MSELSGIREEYTERPAALWEYLHSQGVVIKKKGVLAISTKKGWYYMVEPLIEVK